MTEAPKTHNAAEVAHSANAFATGGGGTIFELKVQASLMVMLLVHGYVPAFENSSIHELYLQTGHLGYETDDALVVAFDSNGQRRRQLWSMKHGVKFTVSDGDFRNVINDAWADFMDGNRFDRDLDAIILATGSLVAANKHLLTLLEIARTTLSVEDFFTQISQKVFTSQKCRDYLVTIQGLCKDVARREVTDDEVWRFLRCFHILGYDFDQSASQDEARLKTLLALVVHTETGITGNELWNKIVYWVANSNPRAGGFTRDLLPEEWQRTVGSLAMHFESGVIHRLLEHSSDLRKLIKTSLGTNIHLPRKELVLQLGTAFSSQQFTLVTGQAGAGKSAAALMALEEIKGGAPLFIFQATEFARDSLEHALADLRVQEPLSRISSLFALHMQKFILIESVERLLESPQPDGFFTFLTKLAEDSTWRVVLTCRQHAAIMVRDAFLSPLELNYEECIVPLLSDTEVDLVIRQVLGLNCITVEPRTRELLRNPWILDKACAINWTREGSDSTMDLRHMRDILWRQVVIHEDQQAHGMHLQRERCFREIALRRAYSLQTFVSIEPGEEEAVQALLADEVLVIEPYTHSIAPAHDVLEDWALIRWVAESYLTNGQEPNRFFEVLGNKLPIRRSYRQWLQEALATGDISTISTFVDDVISSSAVQPYWKDETLVSILLSDEASRFIENHEPSLLANGKCQLQRLIHLLKIACKKPNPLWALSEEVQAAVFGDFYLVPDGMAWGAIVRLIHRNLDSFSVNDLPLVLGFLEDLKSGISRQGPLPEAAREVGLVALHFWKSLDDHFRFKEHFERLTSIILAVPHAIPSEFNDVLTELISSDSRSQRFEVLQEKLLTSLECWAPCWSHPKAVAALAEKDWGIDRPMPTRSRGEISGIDMEEFFGLSGGHFEYFPASALQGPFFSLLRESPDVGVCLILKLCNVATERYVKLQLLDERSERPIELEVNLGDGNKCKQWANARLWMMYREGMPGPYVLHSGLMALEKWLLDLAKSGYNLQEWARLLIRSSNSVCITAVLASIAMAYPKSLGDVVLTFMRTPSIFALDLKRYIYDQHPVSSMLADWAYIAPKRIYSRERVESDKLEHRKYNLESLVCNIQLGPLRDNAWGIIDEFKRQLPPAEKQDDGDKLWRLLLHRIDLRNFAFDKERDDGRIAVILTPPDQDILEVVEKTTPTLQSTEETLSVMNWGMSVFKGQDINKYSPERWHDILLKIQCKVQQPSDQNTGEIITYKDACGYAVAVCVRDHWNELTPEERHWCREFLLEAIMSDKDNMNRASRLQVFPMASSRAAAQVLPLLAADTNEAEVSRVREAIAAAITHAVVEVQQFVAVAVGQYLWTIDADLASACITGLLDLAQLERSSYELQRKQPFDTRVELHDLVWQGIEDIRGRIAKKNALEQDRVNTIDVGDPFVGDVLTHIANIIIQRQQDPLAQRIMLRISKFLVRSWERDKLHKRERNYEAESLLRKQLTCFMASCDNHAVLVLWEPFTKSLPVHAHEVIDVFKDLIYAEDVAKKGVAFWTIWATTRDSLLGIPTCIDQLGREHNDLAGLASVLLLDGV